MTKCLRTIAVTSKGITRLRVVGLKLLMNFRQCVLRRGQYVRLEGAVHTTSLAGGFDWRIDDEQQNH